MQKLLKDCGFTPRVALKDPRSEQIEKLEMQIEEKGLDLSWKKEKRESFKKDMEAKKEMADLTGNSKILPVSDKRKKAKVKARFQLRVS